MLICSTSVVYHKRGYNEIIERAAEHSMQAAVEEVQALTEYAEKGEVQTKTIFEEYMYIIFFIHLNH